MRIADVRFVGDDVALVGDALQAWADALRAAGAAEAPRAQHLAWAAKGELARADERLRAEYRRKSNRAACEGTG